MSEPLGKVEAVVPFYSKVGEKFGEGGIDRFSPIFIGTSSEDVGLFWFFHLLHDHDFGNGFLKSVVSGTLGLEFVQRCLVGGIPDGLRFCIERGFGSRGREFADFGCA